MLHTKRYAISVLTMLTMTGCGNDTASDPKPSDDETSYEFVRAADANAKLIALRGPGWSKQDLTYVLSACWKFSSGTNVSYGRGTCALAMEELALPTTEIDHDTENPMASCYTAAQTGLWRAESIDKYIDGGMSAMDAILKHNEESSDLETLSEEFANCQSALPGISREVKLVPVGDYASKAAELMPGRRKREGMEALETAFSLTWPNEQVDDKANNRADTVRFESKRKAEAAKAIEDLR